MICSVPPKILEHLGRMVVLPLADQPASDSMALHGVYFCCTPDGSSGGVGYSFAVPEKRTAAAVPFAQRKRALRFGLLLVKNRYRGD